mgnify:CR=1 FL=1|tara:strand:- start:194 stop:475 length:282 start_codon:yes stop_codon:yes gene_type:complete
MNIETYNKLISSYKNVESETQWNEKTSSLLLGKTITLVRYMNDNEQEELGWYNKAVVIQLDDGTALIPTPDNKRNKAGALYTTNAWLPIIPVI